MKNYDFWKIEKNKNLKENKIILILSWIFYKTFDDDSRFLSDKFWFKIKVEWWYETVWFPESVLEKYLKILEKQNIWYIVFEKNNWILEQKNNFKWWKNIEYNKENLIFFEKNKNIEKVNFQNFLKDLKILIQKYI